MINITNIKINYMILERILKVTNKYETLINYERYGFLEFEFLEFVFKWAKTGELYNRFKDEHSRNAVFEKFKEITGVPVEYWAGHERIKLGMRIKPEKNFKDKDFVLAQGSIIDNINLDIDAWKELYERVLINPLNINSDDIYRRANKAEQNQDINDDELKVIDNIYSLDGLITMLLINMSNEIKMIDITALRIDKSWQHYINISRKRTKEGIKYSPKFIEIRKGFVQTIIKNIYEIPIYF